MVVSLRYFGLLCLLALSSTLSAQKPLQLKNQLSGVDVWLGVDSGMTAEQCRGHFVLLHQLGDDFNENKRVSRALKEIKRDFPFLLIAHRADAFEVNPTYYGQYLKSRFDLPGVLGLDTLPKERDARKFILYDTKNQRLAKVMNWSTSELREYLSQEVRRYSDDPYAFRQENWTRWPLNIRDAALLNVPTDIAVDEFYGEVYVSDQVSHRIMVFSRDGRLLRIIGGSEQGGADGGFSQSSFDSPADIEYVQANRYLFILEPFSQRIRRADMNTGEVTTLSFTDEGGEDFEWPTEPIAMQVSGDELLFLLDDRSTILRVNWRSNEVIEKMSLPVGSKGLRKKTKRSQLRGVEAFWDSEDGLYILESGSHDLIRWERPRLELLYTQDPERAKDFGIPVSSDKLNPDKLVGYKGDLYLLDSEEVSINRIEGPSSINSMLDSVQYIDMHRLGGCHISSGGIYFTDPTEGRIGMIDEGLINLIRPYDYEEIISLPKQRTLLMADVINPDTLLQTVIEFKLELPEDLILDADMTSTIGLSATSKAVLDDNRVLPESVFEIFITPSMRGRQVDLMADVFLVAKEDPNKAYFMPLRIIIPFDSLVDMSNRISIKASFEQWAQ